MWRMKKNHLSSGEGSNESSNINENQWRSSSWHQWRISIRENSVSASKKMASSA